MHYQKKIQKAFKYISPGIIAWAICLSTFAQCPTHQQFWDKIIEVEKSTENTEQNLEAATQIKNQFEKCGIEKDSVYARILHRIGALKYQKNNYDEDAIKNTISAVRINISGKPGASLVYAVNNYLNLGFYCTATSRYNQALLYYDSSIAIGAKFASAKKYIEMARLRRGNIYYKKGDFEKDIQETILGLHIAEEIKDTDAIVELRLERAQSYEIMQKLPESLADINTSLALLQKFQDNFLLANAYRDKADVLGDLDNFSEAMALYKTAIAYRKKGTDTEQIATDYNDAGYLLMYKWKNTDKAKKYFDTAYRISSSAKLNNVCALACDNLAQVDFFKKNYVGALRLYQQSIQLLLPSLQNKDIFCIPSYRECASCSAKNRLELFLDNKAKCLLELFKQSGENIFLNNSIAASLLADSVITDFRHEQSDDQSKLFWRDDTRDFFSRAVEASFLANDAAKAFYFMEKSRAVLLNDKLNELGAAALLPTSEAAKQENFQAKIIGLEENFSSLTKGSQEYASAQMRLLNAKDNFNRYTHSLEKNYPAYYQYKYADNVPSLQELQNYLAAHNQSFVHYFMNDTMAYILAITPKIAKIISLSSKEFDGKKLVDFLRLCSDKQMLNNHFDSFARASHQLYQTLFQPLQLPKGRAIICFDNFLIPFEALCVDKNGKQFLINDYAFSYVYSARYLMKAFTNADTKENFLGIAPVNFSANLDVPDLLGADDAMERSASQYSNIKLLTHADASHNNFIHQVAHYSVVNIFSHARADSTNEPLLFMQDSVVHLSELQLLNDPATQLIVLSACQTNVGKNATGEGIYSLARGFAAAGIPSVAATLWKADDQTIYAISEKFHEYLSQGMPKDKALQKAKLYFIENNSTEKMLPYYWANMVLAGNAEPIRLSANVNEWWWMAGACVLLVTLTFFMLRKTGKPAAK